MKTFNQFMKDLEEEKQPDDPCWKGYEQFGTKTKNGKKVPNCIPVKKEVKHDIDLSEAEVGDGFILEFANVDVECTIVGLMEDGIIIALDEHAMNLLSEDHVLDVLTEADYQGRKVQLNKIMKGDVKKSKVYVKGPSGRVVKVNFGDPNMRIKKHIPARRKSFRARHRCDDPGPKHKARYWACKTW